MKRIALLLLPLLIAGCTSATGPAPGLRILWTYPVAVGEAPTWTQDGLLLFVGSSDHGPTGPAMLVNPAHPEQPRQITRYVAVSPALSPDGSQVAYTSPQVDTGRRFPPMTLYIQPVDGRGEPRDLLPGDLAVKSVSTSKRVHRWLDNRTVAFAEHMGTAIQALFLADAVTGEVTETHLDATGFTWSPDGRRVAGQMIGGPPSFWVWDRVLNRKLAPAAPLPGQYQYFEAWSDDGRALLFTAWQGAFPYSGEPATVTLYRLDLDSGKATRLAENAGLAAWSGDRIAYVQMGSSFTLTVARAADGAPLWSDELGAPAPDPAQLLHMRPAFAGPDLAYRTGAGEHRISPMARKAPVTVYTGRDALLTWSPDARFGALTEGETLKLITR